jgi:ssDNA-binding Zn-finger/Zn-ribbon topoisomerase 1
MGEWILQSEDEMLPDWLKSSLRQTCPYCGSPMMNYYNDNYRCTNRKCSNEECCGAVAAKADFVRKLLKMDGLGFKTCLSEIKATKSKTPFELLHSWGSKPVVSLGMFLRMHCFEGIDNEWEDIVVSTNSYTLDELYSNYDGKWKGLLEKNKELIYNNLQYVTLKERPVDLVKTGPRLVLNIMITGTPIGFQSKDHFIATVNQLCRGIIVVKHQVTKRQSGVDCLIREPGSTTRGKVEAAQKGGIPIVTSQQFLEVIKEKMESYASETQDK